MANFQVGDLIWFPVSYRNKPSHATAHVKSIGRSGIRVQWRGTPEGLFLPWSKIGGSLEGHECETVLTRCGQSSFCLHCGE